VSENCAETYQSKLPVGSRLEGASPTSYGYWYGFRLRPAKNLVGIVAIAVYYREPEAKMEIPGYTLWRRNPN
jgi:hypothetical protein